MFEKKIFDVCHIIEWFLLFMLVGRHNFDKALMNKQSYFY